MKMGVEAEINDNNKPRFGLNLEFNIELIGIATVAILSVTAVVLVKTVCKSNNRRGSLEICGLGKLRIGGR